jgi:hypothetical protein
VPAAAPELCVCFLEIICFTADMMQIVLSDPVVVCVQAVQKTSRGGKSAGLRRKIEQEAGAPVAPCLTVYRQYAANRDDHLPFNGEKYVPNVLMALSCFVGCSTIRTRAFSATSVNLSSPIPAKSTPNPPQISIPCIPPWQLDQENNTISVDALSRMGTASPGCRCAGALGLSYPSVRGNEQGGHARSLSLTCLRRETDL